MSGPVIPNQGFLSVGLTPLAYMGVRPTSPAQYLIETRDPTTTDKNYILGTWWFNNNTPYNLWRLVNLNAGVALWILVNASPGALLSLTSNTGGPVFPLAGNINVVGDGITITGVGNPGTHTITFSLLGTGVVETLTGNSGGAVSPIAGNINVVGDGVTATVAGNPGTHTLTITSIGTGTVKTLTGNSGGAVGPDGAGNINTVGTGVITVVGNPGTNTLTITPSGAIASSFPTDSGTATPALGVLNILAQNATLGCGSSVLFSAPGPANTVQLNVTDASSNTIVGNNAGNLTLSGSNNTALGKTVLHAMTTANNNTVVGSLSGALITTGGSNTIYGEGAATALTTGTSNLIIGQGAGTALTSSESSNLYINYVGIVGRSNLRVIGNVFSNYADVTAQRENTFIGINAGNFTTSGAAGGNIAIGQNTLTSITTGFDNIAIAGESLFGLTTGTSNVAIGISAGYDQVAVTGLTTGTLNVLVGHTAGNKYTSSESNNVVIGINNGVVGDNNTIRIGSDGGSSANQTRCFINGIRGITTTNVNAIPVLIDSAGQLGTVSSSLRYKENIEQIGCDSSPIYSLNPVQFNYKIHSPESKSVGLIAEEVAQVMPRLVIYDSEGLPETVKYQDLVPLLLNELIRLEKRLSILEGKYDS